MNNLTKLRRELARSPIDAAGRRRHSAAARTAVRELATSWRDSGRTQAELALKLGISAQTLATWLYSKPTRKRPRRLREVVVTEPRAKAEPRQSAVLSIRLPSGAEICGLDVPSALELARALG